jgi:hypothetical protein
VGLNGKHIGRPKFPWNEKLEKLICSRLSKGQSLISICKRKRFPSYQVIMQRIFESESFAKMYARARELQAERMAEEIVAIADDGTLDWIETSKGEIPNLDHINRSRLRVEARKWVAAKLLPKKYGDTGNKTEVNVSTAVVILDPQRQEQLQERRKVAEVEAVKLLDSGTKP